MGLRIQNNVEAFNAHRQLTATASKAAKSMEKLSSGYRINRAADDAAGLAISEKMRGQIGGLAQAQRNAQDGISLVQTAEGALTEVHSMLQRVRDLKVQYNNGTLERRRQGRRSRPRSQQLGKEITDITDQHRVQRHQAAVRPATRFTFQVGADDGETITLDHDRAVGRRRHRRHRRSRRAHRHRRRRRRPRPTPRSPRSTLDDIDDGDQERLERARRLRRGPEPPRAPPRQPGDLPGEPGGVRVAGSATWTWPRRWSSSRSSSILQQAGTSMLAQANQAPAGRPVAAPGLVLPDTSSATGGPSGRPFAFREFAKVAVERADHCACKKGRQGVAPAALQPRSTRRVDHGPSYPEQR